MSSTALSPFIDHPDVSDVLRDDSQFNNRQTISNLRFQLASLETEKDLLKKENDGLVDAYERLLGEKNEELKKLQTNFDYLYEEKSNLQSKLTNQQQIEKSSSKNLQHEFDKLKLENTSLNSKIQSLESTNRQLSKNLQKIQYEYNSQNSINNQLSNQVQQLKSTINDINKENSNLVSKLTLHSQKLKLGSDVYDSLNAKNASLQRINSNLQAKVDQFLQNKTQNELLKQKISGLSKKLDYLNNIEEKYCQLEIDYLQLKSNFDNYFQVIDNAINSQDLPEIKVRKFAEKFKEIEYQSLVYQEKYNEINSQFNQSQSELKSLSETNNELNEMIESLSQELQAKNDIIIKLERQNVLKSDEIDFLRKLNKELTKKEEANSETKSFQEYVTNLETLVERHRNEIAQLQKQNASVTTLQSTPNKRSRPIDDNGNIIDYQKINLELSSKIKQLQDDLKTLQQKLTSYETISSKKKDLTILKLKNNPADNDQKIKLETLNLLRQENESLLQKTLDALDTVPKAVFERQEFDKQSLQMEINQLVKRNKRLTDTYSQKSKEILAAISKFFGFSIEFLSNPMNPKSLSSRIKLTSRYIKDVNTYLILNIDSRSLKAVGDSEFKDIIEQLLLEWVEEKGQIPCFLSALTLKLHEKYL